MKAYEQALAEDKVKRGESTWTRGGGGEGIGPQYVLFPLSFFSRSLYQKGEKKSENFQMRYVQEQLREQLVTLHGW